MQHVSSHLRATWWEEELGLERGITAHCNMTTWFPKSVSSRQLKDTAVFRFNYCPAARGSGGCQRPVEIPFGEGQRAAYASDNDVMLWTNRAEHKIFLQYSETDCYISLPRNQTFLLESGLSQKPPLGHQVRLRQQSRALLANHESRVSLQLAGPSLT